MAPARDERFRKGRAEVKSASGAAVVGLIGRQRYCCGYLAAPLWPAVPFLPAVYAYLL